MINLQPESNNFNDYLNPTKIIDLNNVNIQNKAYKLAAKDKYSITIIKNCFEFVRDEIKHSKDYNFEKVTCIASDVLSSGHGICNAKAHLLAALLRANKIPTGFCYQKLILDDNNPNIFCLHGLNAAHIESLGKWIRFDARGNKQGVQAEFSTTKEQLAFPVRQKLGEIDYSTIYAEPMPQVIAVMLGNKNISDLWKNLPEEM